MNPREVLDSLFKLVALEHRALNAYRAAAARLLYSRHGDGACDGFSTAAFADALADTEERYLKELKDV